MLLSLKLFGDTTWSDEKQIACLYALSKHVEDHYSLIRIPKHNGLHRQLSVPDSLLKSVQRNILHHVLSERPVSPHAKAYRSGANVISNAIVHVGQKKILKLDIEDFFTSISFLMVYKHAFPSIFFPPSVRTLLTHLCCYRDALPQGAPTSPAISNFVMRSFDDYMGQWCKERQIAYTRYCDDMTFSGDFDGRMVKNKARSFLQTLGFELNHKKTKLLTQSYPQNVTGLIVNKKAQPPIQYRKALRQEIYYCQRYGVISHLARTNDTDFPLLDKNAVKKYLASLLGKINFVLQSNQDDIYFREAKSMVRKILSTCKD